MQEKQPSATGSSWAFGIAGGVLLASMRESVEGFVIGALIGVLFAQVLSLRTRIQRFDEALQDVRRKLQILATPAATTAASAAPVKPEAKTRPDPSVSATESAIQPVAVPAAVQIPARREEAARVPQTPIQRPAIRPAASASVTRPAGSYEPSMLENAVDRCIDWIKGGNPLARVGIVILFFGGVFLAKYAAENSLFPVELRFAAIAIGAFALLIIGWRLKDKQSVYAQLLQGGGIAGLYLTVFAASRLYDLIPMSMALPLLIVIALASAVLAVAQNSLSLAVIGTTGGFLAPILVSSGGGNHVALFTYYTVLNLGVFAVAWFRTWKVLNVIGFVFTFTITGLWRAKGYETADLASTDGFLILFFLMYVGVSVLNCVRQPPDLKGYVSGSLVFGLPVVAFSLHASLVSHIEYALAWSAFALGAFYLALGWALFKTRRQTFRLLVESFAALGVIFGSLAIPLAFDTRTTAAMWSVEGAGLLWLGIRQDRRLARAFGVLLQFGGALGFLSGLGTHSNATPVLNATFFGGVMLALAGLFSSVCLYRNRENEAPYEKGAYRAFALWGVAWWLFMGIRELDTHLASAVLGTTLLYVAATAILLHVAGRKLLWPFAETIALLLPAAASVVCLLYCVDAGHPFVQWGALGWPALLVVQYFLLHRVDTERSDAWPDVAIALHVGMWWIIAVLLGWEGHWQVMDHASGVWPALPWALAPALLLSIVSRRRLVPQWPLAKFAATYRLAGSAPLVVGILIWLVIVNLTNPGDPVWLPYLPLLNPLDIVVLLCFGVLTLWWTALDKEQRAKAWSLDPRTMIAGVAAIVFLWLNAALIRSLHHLWGTPITLHGIATNTFIQASLSIFWGLLGFAGMTLAARKHWRYVWIVGGGLMLIVVAKLFLIDLSSIGTIARIASFLSVGVLLLVTGYLAPLPPRQTEAVNS